MIKKSMVIKLNGKKANAMPTAVLVQVVSQYESSIYVDDADKHVNAKGTMGMMILGLTDSLEIVVTMDGRNKDAAITGIEEYLCR